MNSRTMTSRPAFTLMELTVSLAVSALLMAALGSAVAIAAAALPSEDAVQTRVLGTSRSLERLSADLESAVYVLDLASDAPIYAIPDRNADGEPDTQALSWSGKRGDPVRVVENGATPETVLDNAAGFDATWRPVSVTETLAPLARESAASTLASYPSAPSDLDRQNLYAGSFWCQYIAPTLPVDAIAWCVDEISIAGVRAGGTPNGVITAQIRVMVEGEAPSDTILEEVTFPETRFASSSLSWTPIEFPEDVWIAPGQDIGLLLTYQSGSGSVGSFAHEDGRGVGLWYAYASSGLGSLLSGDKSPSWGPAHEWQMLYKVEGRYRTSEPGGEVTHTFIASVDVFLSAAGDTDVPMETTVNLVNRPQIVDSIWGAEFSADPTDLDLNADGVSDWVRPDAGGFDTPNLSGGVWKARHALRTKPAKDMTGVVVGKIRWRATDEGQPGATWTLTFDQSGGLQGNVTLQIAKVGPDEQAVAMITTDGAGTTNTLGAVSGLGAEMVDVRVVVDPVEDRVSLRVNGEEVGSYEYLLSVYADEDRVSTITPLGTGVEIDGVWIREGGTP
ncbi:MAG: type II secretion system protein J [Phycisphaerales bacterium JB059]